MTKKIFLIATAFISFNAFLSSAMAESDNDAFVKQCLKKWKTHPFGKDPEYRTIQTRVKVLGIGGDINDKEKTDKPELILVKPGVGVMTKTVYNLHNPNGWYCLKGRVSVLGKMEINVGCKAKIAASDEDIAVLGSADQKTGGVAVLGSVRFFRDCGQGRPADEDVVVDTSADTGTPPAKEEKKDEKPAKEKAP